MKTYRKKPVLVNAMQFDGSEESARRIIEWMSENSNAVDRGFRRSLPHLLIHTLEGIMRAEPGDFIICGVNGEFYPCKPDIFEKTYEEVSAQSVFLDRFWADMRETTEVNFSPDMSEAVLKLNSSKFSVEGQPGSYPKRVFQISPLVRCKVCGTPIPFEGSPCSYCAFLDGDK